MRRTEAAYVAGVIDGEGYIAIYRRGKNGTRLRLRVGNTNMKILQALQSFTGVGIIRRQRGPGKPYWFWNVDVVDGTTVLREVLPFLKGKEEQARRWLSIAELRGH